eukprot:TRINITY_DN10420_c0_g1_i2.p1 TRINITY_DN10420_c0_g1~~TRINITY_DN10420_c0_g1_i2.p1  ORF type:complete len:214 (+),score=11.77 TRINITY_DN10420_c0_g1_i2:683-1324(+)
MNNTEKVDKIDQTMGGANLSEDMIATECKDCPNCFIPLQKYTGCDAVQCYKCKHRFCYRCRQPLAHHLNCPGEGQMPSQEELENQWETFKNKGQGSNPNVKKEEWIETRRRREREIREIYVDTQVLRQKFVEKLLQEMQLRKLFIVSAAIQQKSGNKINIQDTPELQNDIVTVVNLQQAYDFLKNLTDKFFVPQKMVHPNPCQLWRQNTWCLQ